MLKFWYNLVTDHTPKFLGIVYGVPHNLEVNWKYQILFIKSNVESYNIVFRVPKCDQISAYFDQLIDYTFPHMIGKCVNLREMYKGNLQWSTQIYSSEIIELIIGGTSPIPPFELVVGTSGAHPTY